MPILKCRTTDRESLTSGLTEGTVLRSWLRERNVSEAGWRSGPVTRTEQPSPWCWVRPVGAIACDRPPISAWAMKGRLPSMSTSTVPTGRTKVLLVDDHDLIRKGLRHAFERDRQFEVVGEAGTAAEAVRQAGALQPDVVIMDLRLPDGSGLEATRALRKGSATMGIVVLTMYAGDDQLFGALEAGASAFVPKTAPADEVVAAARHAASAPSAFTAADLAEAMKRRLAPSGPQLSPREGQVLRLLADGMSVAGIAKQLFVSESTAKTHISKLYEKLGAANRAQALMTALRLGLLEAPDQPKF